MNNQSPSPLLQPLRTLTGILLLVLGILSLMLPILPGWLFIFGGILMAFPESGKVIVARVKAWREKHISSASRSGKRDSADED